MRYSALLLLITFGNLTPWIFIFQSCVQFSRTESITSIKTNENSSYLFNLVKVDWKWSKESSKIKLQISQNNHVWAVEELNYFIDNDDSDGDTDTDITRTMMFRCLSDKINRRNVARCGIVRPIFLWKREI